MTDIDITVDDENTETHEETTPDFAHAAIVAGAVAGVAVIGYVGVRFVKRQIVKRVMKKVLDDPWTEEFLAAYNAELDKIAETE